METPYQQKVNDLTGGMGPTNSAFWLNTDSTTGNPFDLAAQPLYFSPSSGVYVTAFDSNQGVQGILEGPTSFGTLGELGPQGTWDPSTAPSKGAFGHRNRRSRKAGRKGSRKAGRKGSRKGSRKAGRKGSRKGRKAGRKVSFGCPLGCGFGTKMY